MVDLNGSILVTDNIVIKKNLDLNKKYKALFRVTTLIMRNLVLQET